MAGLGDVITHVYRGGPITRATVEALERGSQAWSLRSSAPSPLLIVVEPAVPPPEDDVRRRLADYMLRYQDRTLVEAAVYEQEGFRGAVVRGVMTGLRVLARAKHPAKTFAELSEAVPWLLEQLSPAQRARAPELLAAVRALRADLSPGA